MVWTTKGRVPQDVRDAVLDRWADGTLSASAIGAALGIGKNEVIGIVNRAREAGDARAVLRHAWSARRPDRPAKNPTTRAAASSFLGAGAGNCASVADPPVRRRVAMAAERRGQVPPAAIRPVEPLRPPAPPSPALHGGCRWPMWGRERPVEPIFCGAPRRAFSCSYCAAHAAVAFKRLGEPEPAQTGAAA